MNGWRGERRMSKHDARLNRYTIVLSLVGFCFSIPLGPSDIRTHRMQTYV